MPGPTRRGLIPLLLLAGCGTTALPLTYVAQSPPVAANRPVVAIGTVTVTRRAGSDDPLWLGTIRGGYGNPLKHLNSDVPVDQTVARAVTAGLQQRGLAAAGAGRYRLDIVVMQLDSNQYVRREATAEFRATLVEAASGRTVWTDTARAYRVDGSIVSLSTGVFASTDDLHATMTRALGEAVDKVLDAPGFRAALA